MAAKVIRAPVRRDPRTAVLLLPGMTLNETVFPDLGMPTVAPDFNELALGEDGAGDTVRGARMDLYVRLLQDALAVAPAWVGAERRVVIGHSFGGMLALRWLLADPMAHARLHGLVLVATTAGPMFDVVQVRMRLGRLVVRVPLRPLMPLWNRPGVTRVVKWLVCGSLDVHRVDFRRLPRPTDAALDLAGWRNTDWRAMRSYRLAMEGFDVRADLGRLAVRTVVLHGTRDTLLPMSAGQALANGLPNAELWLVKGAGHGLPLTHGAWVERAVDHVLGA